MHERSLIRCMDRWIGDRLKAADEQSGASTESKERISGPFQSRDLPWLDNRQCDPVPLCDRHSEVYTQEGAGMLPMQRPDNRCPGRNPKTATDEGEAAGERCERPRARASVRTGPYCGWLERVGGEADRRRGAREMGGEVKRESGRDGMGFREPTNRRRPRPHVRRSQKEEVGPTSEGRSML